MSRIVFAWELGGGYGHLGPFRPITERLVSAGHQVTIIAKDIARAAVAFRGLDVTLFPSPVKLSKAVPYDPAPSTFGHLLQNMGYRDPLELNAMIHVWRNLFQVTRPDCLVLDHCPTGLLAARGIDVPQFTFGTGFFCPVDEFPLREMAPWRPMDKEERIRSESQLIDRINTILESNGQPTIARIGEIYSSVTANLLTTFRELDHYPYRQQGEYLGAWSATNSANNRLLPETPWPEGDGPKVYAYLKPHKSLRELLMWLSGQGLPTLVVGDGLDGAGLSKSLRSNVKLVSHHLNLRSVGETCDLAIMNGNHGTCCEFLLAGRSMLHIPLTFEQAIFSRRTVELGVALDASPDQPRQIIQQLSALINSGTHRQAAQDFASRHASFRAENGIDRCSQRISQAL
ncbi:MurG-like transferase [Bremerella volcania]|uniref:MurG-like transferase n=1 Tax=Bremerella volcania TaxID=2527984 RepID=A0A518C8Y9_9BACT|nr:glycosyltransferase family 1 protein [Bremerella volcania]QDU75687.1 MurG-like transferase [Bremerella volcania]